MPRRDVISKEFVKLVSPLEALHPLIIVPLCLHVVGLSGLRFLNCVKQREHGRSEQASLLKKFLLVWPIRWDTSSRWYPTLFFFL